MLEAAARRPKQRDVKAAKSASWLSRTYVLRRLDDGLESAQAAQPSEHQNAVAYHYWRRTAADLAPRQQMA